MTHDVVMHWQANTLDGWQRSEVSQQENEAGEWAAQQQLDAQQQDVHRLCFKQLGGEVRSVSSAHNIVKGTRYACAVLQYATSQ